MWHPRSDIDRLLAGALDADRAVALRLHLSICEDCRRRHDEAVLLERALSGDVHRPTAREEARMVERALRIVPAPRGGGGVLVARPLPVRRLVATLAGAALAVAAALFVTSPVATFLEGEGVRIGGALAVEGTPIRFWSRIEVDGTGYGLLKLEGAQVTLSGGTALRVELGGRALALSRSKVWCEVERGRGGFAVRTEEAVARVRGTSFAVDRSAPGETHVRVREGSVEVRGAHGGEPVFLGGGTRTTVRAGEVPQPPAAYTGVEDADLLLLLRRLGHAIGRGLDGAIEWLRQGPAR
jgi:ferric-dicitrate binding protein FerR (iron transport regulator)